MVALDGRDRFYIGGTDRTGRPWLRREDGWQMETTTIEATIVGIVFDNANRPILLVSGSSPIEPSSRFHGWFFWTLNSPGQMVSRC